MHLHDLTTPGSFWLNPPLPSDAEGNLYGGARAGGVAGGVGAGGGGGGNCGAEVAMAADPVEVAALRDALADIDPP